MSRQSGKITVPDDLRDLLLEFTISYLLEQPGDILDYAVEFFTKLRENRQTTLIKLGHSESADDSLSMEEGRYFHFRFPFSFILNCFLLYLFRANCNLRNGDDYGKMKIHYKNQWHCKLIPIY